MYCVQAVHSCKIAEFLLVLVLLLLLLLFLFLEKKHYCVVIVCSCWTLLKIILPLVCLQATLLECFLLVSSPNMYVIEI